VPPINDFEIELEQRKDIITQHKRELIVILRKKAALDSPLLFEASNSLKEREKHLINLIKQHYKAG